MATSDTEMRSHLTFMTHLTTRSGAGLARSGQQVNLAIARYLRNLHILHTRIRSRTYGVETTRKSVLPVNGLTHFAHFGFQQHGTSAIWATGTPWTGTFRGRQTIHKPPTFGQILHLDLNFRGVRELGSWQYPRRTLVVSRTPSAWDAPSVESIGEEREGRRDRKGTRPGGGDHAGAQGAI